MLNDQYWLAISPNLVTWTPWQILTVIDIQARMKQIKHMSKHLAKGHTHVYIYKYTHTYIYIHVCIWNSKNDTTHSDRYPDAAQKARAPRLKTLLVPFSKLKAKLCSSLCSHLPENQQNGIELCVLRIFICISLGWLLFLFSQAHVAYGDFHLGSCIPRPKEPQK